MREVCALAVAVLITTSALPAHAMTVRDKGHCEQVKKPGLKVTACSAFYPVGT